MKQFLYRLLQKPKGNRNYFLLCLFIAVTAWFTMKMSKTYRVSYAYQVCLKDVPEEKHPIYQSDSTITLNMEGKGLSLLGADLRSKRLQLDYESLLTDYQKQRNVVHIQNRQLMDYLNREKRFEGKLSGVNVNAISFRFEELPKERD